MTKTKDVPEAGLADADYQPPYPERTEVFLIPDRALSNAVANGDPNQERVMLMGFVEVDEPRAVLQIDGEIAPLPVGGERYGVRVVSVAPPKVVLERGRDRWTTSLD